MNHENRVGNFTSSQIGKLTALAKNGVDFGKPALTYIEEKRMERAFGLPLNSDTSSRPTVWGSFLEKRVFDLLGIRYVECSQVTIVHPEYSFWAGSPDGKTEEDTVVCDVKCPYTRKSFYHLAVGCERGSIQYIRDNHDSGEDYYWQIVSNAILTGAKFGELIVYIPYLSELRDIRDEAANYEGDQNKVAWIGFANDNDLPFILDGGTFKNLNKLRFEIPQVDKDFLTSLVIKAGKLLG